MSDEIIVQTFRTVQKFLERPPVIIWGSGATIPFNLPSMTDLNHALKEKIDNFNTANNNLENELGKSKYEKRIPKIRRIIWNTVAQADKQVLKELTQGFFDDFEPIQKIINKFRDCHPRVVNIVTTNYDCVLEYVMGYCNIPFTDGFSGRDFSIFSDANFEAKNLVNLIKVHGSLSWFRIQNKARFSRFYSEFCEPIIICPGIKKYQEAYQEPYRTLIQKADRLIENANGFLIIGFGFNDEHLTPKIIDSVNSGVPLVLITKEVTESCTKEMGQAQKYIFLQKCKGSENKTLVIAKKGKEMKIEKKIIDGNYWKLTNFIEVL